MKYFKLTDESGSRMEYIKVLDDVTELKTKSETTNVEEISEEDYENALNPKTSRWDLFMPTISDNNVISATTSGGDARDADPESFKES